MFEQNTMATPVITPRMARDDCKYRDELQKRLSSIDGEQNDLLFDLSGSRELQITSANINLSELENELWDLVKTAFTGNVMQKAEVDTVASMFSFSPTLCEIFKISAPERFDLLKDNSLLSFTLTEQCQRQMLHLFNQRLSSKCSDVYHTRFWSCLVIILQSDTAENSSFKLGLLPELTAVLKGKSYMSLIEFLSYFPIQLTLRCSEEVIANILHSQSVEEEKSFLELKYLQIISGCRCNAKFIANKFARLVDMGIY